uniref:C2H2-type domain-containing protein n=1 Tax=Ditylenchus dipsaci TaxID=166011 RepID=A0A915DE35_9BILA
MNQYHFLQKATSTLTQEAEALIQQTYGSDWSNEIDPNSIPSPPNTSSSHPAEAENICSWEQDLWDLDSNGYKDLISALYDDLIKADSDSLSSFTDNADQRGWAKRFWCKYLTNSRTQFWRHKKSSNHIMNMEQTRACSSNSDSFADISKKITCEECDYSTNNAFNLKRHVLRIHTKQKNSHCKYCAKRFKDNDTMRTHIAYMHAAESPVTLKQYKCNNCVQTFRSSSDYLRHQRIVHQGHRKFQCSECKKSFQTGANAHRHYTNVCGKNKGKEKEGAQNLWKEDGACQSAFFRIKEVLASDLLLTHYNPLLPITIAANASNVDIGAVLLYQMPDGPLKAVVHASRTLPAAEKNYSQIEKRSNDTLDVHSITQLLLMNQ